MASQREGQFLCQRLRGPDLRTLWYLVLVYGVHLQHMTTLARHKCGRSGGISTFPIELLSDLLKHLDLIRSRCLSRSDVSVQELVRESTHEHKA